MTNGIDVIAVLDRVIHEERIWGEEELAVAVEKAKVCIQELLKAYQYAFELADSVEGMSRNNIDNIGWEVAQQLGPALTRMKG